MFDQTSRYYNLSTTTLSMVDGGVSREIKYVQRRFIPSTDGMITAVEHLVVQGDRLDNIAARYIGDPTLFWKICDANEVLAPEELTGKIGSKIRIAVPRF
jgi:hypothetical protein